jgi:hypothetical protein
LYDVGFDYSSALSSQQAESANIKDVYPHPIYSVFSTDMLVAFCKLEGFSSEGTFSTNAIAPKLRAIERNEVQKETKRKMDLDTSERWTTALDLRLYKSAFIHKFLAAKQIQWLEEKAEDDKAVIKECIKLAEENNLLSKYTSIIPEDESQVKKKRLQRSVQVEVKHTELKPTEEEEANVLIDLIRLQSADGSWDISPELAEVLQVEWESLKESAATTEKTPKVRCSQDEEIKDHLVIVLEILLQHCRSQLKLLQCCNRTIQLLHHFDLSNILIEEESQRSYRTRI